MSSPALKSILLVDDDKISNLFNKIFIGKLNLDIKVEVALNGKEALNFLTPTRKNIIGDTIQLPCLLLLDIKMPEMSGWEFLKNSPLVVSSLEGSGPIDGCRPPDGFGSRGGPFKTSQVGSLLWRVLVSLMGVAPLMGSGLGFPLP